MTLLARSRVRWRLLSLLVVGLACHHADSRGTSVAGGASYDQAATDRARVLAGLAPAQPGTYRGTVALEAWKTWQRELDVSWTQTEAPRLAAMGAWQAAHVAPLTRGCDTLLYPFSGPDILNALALFPDCSRYVLFGLEHVGAMPDVERLDSDRVSRLLEETRQAMGDLLTRNYAITRHMMRDMQARELRGNLPVLSIFLVRLDARLVGMRPLTIDDQGNLQPAGAVGAHHANAPAIEIAFERPGHPPQVLVYFRAQAEDRALRQRPGVMKFLARQAPFATFLKSASYLLHGNQFTQVRDLLLNGSRLILQDDSGIPVRFFKPADWDVRLFGKYQKPVKDFNYGYQPDLALAYSKQAAEPLTFSFGYHWEAGTASVVIATRRTPPATRP
jgi:hypothetical protein